MEWVGFLGLLIGALLVILFFVENFRVLEGSTPRAQRNPQACRLSRRDKQHAGTRPGRSRPDVWTKPKSPG
ncbi:MAG: hypothetical protein RDV00_08795 [Clostridia bacterium]|nr:hypothetical protein [Clostridia bacterium]